MLRLGELIAFAECAGALARRAATALANSLPDKSDTRFAAETLATMSRVFARDSAAKIAADGARLVAGAGGPDVLVGLQSAINADAISAAQAGLLEDMNTGADALYARETLN